MATMNINSGVTDTFYRYKMPRLVAKVEGKGNGIKTVLVNMDDVSKALNRPATYPTKFFGCELGAQTQMDAKNSRFIVNGSHDAKDLQELLDKFIRKYVLCPQCENPETDMRVSSHGVIKARCVACGWRGEMDNNHRLATFIVRNPPKNDQSISKADKKEKRKERREKEKESTEPKSEGSSKVRKSKEKTKSERSPPITKERRRTAEQTDEGNDDDGQWSMDVSEAAVRARREELESDLGDAVKGMTLTEADYMDMTEKDRLEAFKTFCTKNSNDKELFDEAVRLGIRDKAMAVIAELKFNEGVLSQIKQNRVLLQRFCIGDMETQRCLLGALERLLSVVYPTLLPKTPHVIKMLYDLDIVDEEVLLEWGVQQSSRFVGSENFKKLVAKAEPVLNWLREAESEEDDDVTFDKSGTSAATSPANDRTAFTYPSVGSAAKKADQDGDDIDIDAI